MLQTVTVGVIAYNEQKYLPDLLSDLLKQSYPKHLIELVLVDGKSTDETRMILENFKVSHSSDYRRIVVQTNEKRIQPAGWNVVIQSFSSDILIRIDAHARIPEDFIEKNVDCINSGEFVCGGPRENIIDEDKTEERKNVKSVFHAAYRREVIEKVGLFNEDLIRTEDNEYHYRIREAGYKICYDPSIKSYYQTRSSLKGMIRQKYQNGLWIGRTIFVCPGCISLFHLAPAAFVIAILFCLLLGALLSWIPMTALGVAYGLFLLFSTVVSFVQKQQLMDLLMPFVIVTIHLAYGTGTLVGLIDRRR